MPSNPFNRTQHFEFGRDAALQIDRLIKSIDENVQLSQVLIAINSLDRKVDRFMANQEERLQAILVAVKNVKAMLAELKTNNPAIEDEIAAIETELAPTPEPEPTPEG